MTSSVKFLNYDIKSDPASLEKRKTDGFLSTEIQLLQDLGLLNLSTGTTVPIAGITIPEIGEFLNWIATEQKGEIPPSAKRILCTRLQVMKNPKNLPNATIRFAGSIARQLELLIGDCSKVQDIPTEVTYTTVAASSGVSVAELQKALLPLETKLMGHIDTKFASHKSDTEALKELLKTEIRTQLQAENGLPRIQSALDSKMTALGAQIATLETLVQKGAASSAFAPSLSSSSKSVQSAQSTPQNIETIPRTPLGGGFGTLSGSRVSRTSSAPSSPITSKPTITLPGYSVTKTRWPAKSQTESLQPAPPSTPSSQTESSSPPTPFASTQPAKQSVSSFFTRRNKPVPTSTPTATSSQIKMQENPMRFSTYNKFKSPRRGLKPPGRTRKHRTRK